VPPPDEDVVTLAANAVIQAMENIDARQIDTLMFATESGVDQSKAAGIWVHKLTNLPKNMRVFELKQACYSGAGGLALALPYLLQHPDRKILIVAADIARYGLESVGEPTQGAGAIAMVLSTSPKIMTFELSSGIFTQDVMDFWRPNYRDEALVDGKYSIKMYLRTLMEAWEQYTALSGRRFEDFNKFVYHLPFAKMGEKAHSFLVKHAAETLEESEWLKQIEDAAVYQRVIGNTYAASVFTALQSLLDVSTEDLSGKRIGLFSYGSGSVGEFFSGAVLPGYRTHLHSSRHQQQIISRIPLDYNTYAEFYSYKSNMPTDGSAISTPIHKTGSFRFAGLQEHRRIYEVVG